MGHFFADAQIAGGLHLALFDSGYAIVDIGEPAAPAILREMEWDGWFAVEAAAEGDRVFVVLGNPEGSGLAIVDSASPLNARWRARDGISGTRSPTPDPWGRRS